MRRQQDQTPRTDEFFRTVRLTFNPQDFASPWAQARVAAQIEEMILACHLFSRELEREVNGSVPRQWLEQHQ